MVGRDIWDRRCQIVSVTDGDTVKVRIDDGRRHYSEEAIRLLDVHAVELFSGTPEERAIGTTHRDAVVVWVATHAAHLSLLWPFFVRTYQDRATFNRYVGEIECAEGHSLNEHMRAVIG